MKLGLALRSTVFRPSLITGLVPVLDESGVDSVWFPSVGQAFDALDMCGIALGESHRLRIGSGVIRFTDYDSARLLARVHTLSEGSGGRFVLGIGTGSGTGQSAISGLVEAGRMLRAGYPEPRKPLIFFAALKRKILRAAYSNADGAILNFCPPGFVRKIIPDGAQKNGFTLACYIKLFFAEDDAVAKRMLVDEMKMYNSIPQYHAMFEENGISDTISSLRYDLAIPDPLLKISLVNPGIHEIGHILEEFVKAGVNLPIVYPYISGDDAYRISVVKRISALS